mmetsp:Transcript_28942/g.59352  ORF Transcript_28942/g.59352 Transcript_28942/m.59352 type:complete len:191 (+) Transcript_28942:235-807(+)
MAYKFLALFESSQMNLLDNETNASISSSVYLGPVKKSNELDDCPPEAATLAATAAILAVAVLAPSSSVVSSLNRFLWPANLDKSNPALKEGACQEKDWKDDLGGDAVRRVFDWASSFLMHTGMYGGGSASDSMIGLGERLWPRFVGSSAMIAVVACSRVLGGEARRDGNRAFLTVWEPPPPRVVVAAGLP